jgi:hypothetical protein
MAKSLTARFGLQRWSAGTDTQQRSEFDNDNAQVELLGGIARQGLASARGSATTWPRSTYWSTDTGALDYSDGTVWQPVFGPATAWTAYAAAWQASVTNPAIGDGGLVARYKQIGKTTHFYVSVAAGPATTYGSGTWTFALPSTGQDAYSGGGHSAQAFCNGVRYGGATIEASASRFAVVLNNQVVTNANPGSWGSGNLLIIRGSYEAA